MKQPKMRLDKLLKAQYSSSSRSELQQLIKQGAVRVNGSCVQQTSFLVEEEAVITIDFSQKRYVSRAGIKLEHALSTYGLTVEGMICLDAGLSTGGFTDCLLQHGARKVYGVDVGTAQVHSLIKNDSRVVIMENTDIRSLPQLHEPVDIITLDLSFISLGNVIHHLSTILRAHGNLITLIKPQFEVGIDIARMYQGVIKDAPLQEKVVKNVMQKIESAGFAVQGVTQSPILGGAGNKEFLAYFIKQS